MGMFKKKVKVSNSKNQKQFFEEEFWVDTAALFSCSERQAGMTEKRKVTLKIVNEVRA